MDTKEMLKIVDEQVKKEVDKFVIERYIDNEMAKRNRQFVITDEGHLTTVEI